MRILHISYTTRGGAGKALLRHHDDLRRIGVDSQILIADQSVPETATIHHISNLQNNRTDRFFSLIDTHKDRLANHISHYTGLLPFGNKACLQITDSAWFQKADVIELRQLHSGHNPSYFNMHMIQQMAQQKPVIWRLSDAWAFTGFCCYFFDCNGWRKKCFSCPILREEPSRSETRLPRKDFAWFNLLLKKHIYKKSKLHIASPSRWLLQAAQQSILNKCAIDFHYIPVGVDTDLFNTKHRSLARKRFGISLDDTVLLINIPNMNNYRKGADLLLKCLNYIEDKTATVLIIGKSIPKQLEAMFKHVIITGYIGDDKELAKAYAAGDIFLFSSRQDNSAQVLLEASSSQLPVVCFDVGGNSEYIIHGETGFTTKPFDCNAFAKFISFLIKDPSHRKTMGLAGRNYICNNFSQRTQTIAFFNLYKQSYYMNTID